MGSRKPSFVEVYEEHRSNIYRFVLKRVRDGEDAEDLTALTFLKVFLAYDQFVGESKRSLRAWIFRIAENLVVDYYRAAAKERRALSLEKAALRGVDEREVESQVETAETLRWAIGQLRPRHREVITLRFVEGYRYEEIAGILGLPLGTVQSRLHRALRQLGEILMKRVK